jgi:hypothetical protein
MKGMNPLVYINSVLQWFGRFLLARPFLYVDPEPGSCYGAVIMFDTTVDRDWVYDKPY